MEYFDGSRVPVCLTQADTFWPATFFITTISVFFIIPLAILIILYTIIAKNLMENPGIINQNNKHHNVTGSHLRYRKQVVLMLGTVVLSFFVCLLPFRALTLWIIIVPPENLEDLGVEGYYSILYFCRIMLYLNSAVNPILYNLMSSKFRDGFLKLLKLYKFKKLQRYHKGDNIQRKDTFNTTTSTNYSSSHTSDSFWRRYSNRNASQKSPQKISTNGVARKTSQNGKEQQTKNTPKVVEIVNVQNNRRNSMRFVSDVILVPKDDQKIETNVKLENYLEQDANEILSADLAVNFVENKLDVSNEITKLGNGSKDEAAVVNEVEDYSKDVIVIEALRLGEKKSNLVRIPLLISTNSCSNGTKNYVSHFAKESFV